MRNLKLALRTLARTPFVTVVAVLSLGLGIGANSAIYSIFYRMVRQDLPVAGVDRLVNLSAPGPKNGSQSCGEAGPCEDVFSYPMFRDLQKARLSALTGIAGHYGMSANVSYDRQAFARGGRVAAWRLRRGARKGSGTRDEDCEGDRAGRGHAIVGESRANLRGKCVPGQQPTAARAILPSAPPGVDAKPSLLSHSSGVIEWSPHSFDLRDEPCATSSSRSARSRALRSSPS